jgi:hypothetical protein
MRRPAPARWTDRSAWPRRCAATTCTGTIVTPVFIDTDDDPEVALDSSAFQPVWDVITALRAHDYELGGQLDELRRELVAELGWYAADLDDESIARHRADTARKKTDLDPAKKWAHLTEFARQREVEAKRRAEVADFVRVVIPEHLSGTRTDAQAGHDDRCGEAARVVDRTRILARHHRRGRYRAPAPTTTTRTRTTGWSVVIDSITCARSARPQALRT